MPINIIDVIMGSLECIISMETYSVITMCNSMQALLAKHASMSTLIPHQLAAGLQPECYLFIHSKSTSTPNNKGTPACNFTVHYQVGTLIYLCIIALH